MDQGLLRNLSKYLEHLKKTGEYDVRLYETTAELKMPVAKWSGGVKPPLNTLHAKDTLICPKGTKILVRLNQVDSPPHIDLEILEEKEHAQIQTAHWRAWQLWKRHFREIGSDSPQLHSV